MSRINTNVNKDRIGKKLERQLANINSAAARIDTTTQDTNNAVQNIGGGSPLFRTKDVDRFDLLSSTPVGIALNIPVGSEERGILEVAAFSTVGSFIIRFGSRIVFSGAPSELGYTGNIPVFLQGGLGEDITIEIVTAVGATKGRWQVMEIDS